MRYFRLGLTDMPMSAVAFSGWALAEGEGRERLWDKEAMRVISAAVDAGINFFDTSAEEGGGYVEEVIGKALEKRRTTVYVATKVVGPHLAPKDLGRACEGSLERLRTDHLDLYQICRPNPDIPIDDQIGAMTRLRDEGKVLALGVCDFDARELELAAAAGQIQSDQLPYDLFWRAVEHDIVDACARLEIDVLCYSYLTAGLLRGEVESPADLPSSRPGMSLFETGDAQREAAEAMKRVRAVAERLDLSVEQASIAWLLRQPAVKSVLVSARRDREIKAAAAAADVDIPLEAVDELTRATEALKEAVGRRSDAWMSDAHLAVG